MENIFKNNSISSLHKLLIKREITSVELTEVSLNIAQKQKDCGAFITLCKDRAMKNAKLADQRILKGDTSPLLGIPMGIKDNICLKGEPATCASEMLENFIPPYSATAVNRLEKEGAIIIGKTNMDEFAMGSSSKTSHFGRVLNPYNKNFTAGGSSGGSAAAVALGICPAALGSDTGGSIRQPASFCGVSAIKPSYGSISRYGLIAFASSLDQIGIAANSAEDLALILNAVSGKDPLDMTSLSKPFDTNSVNTDSIMNKTIGIVKELWEGSSPTVLSAFCRAIDFYKSQGFAFKEISIPALKLAPTVYSVISSAEAASNLARYDGVKYGYKAASCGSFNDSVKATRGKAFGFEVKRRIMFGNFVLGNENFAKYYKRGTELREKIKKEITDAFNEVDVILHPTAPTTAFPVNENIQNEKSESADVFTLPANLAGLPSATTNCGYDDNSLPIGVSVTAPYKQDFTALSFISLLEKSKGGI